MTKTLPTPVYAGNAQRTNLVIQALGEFATVDLFLLNGDGARASLARDGFSVVGTADIDDIPLFRFFKYFGERFERIFKVIALGCMPKRFRYTPVRHCADEVKRVFCEGEYDIVIGRYLGASCRAGVHLLHPSIIDIDDLDSQKFRSWADKPGIWPALRFFTGKYLKRLERIEQTALSRVSRIWVSASEDQSTLGIERTDIIPNIPFHRGEALGPSPATGPILFVGSFDYRINVNSIWSFLAGGWAALFERNGDLKLRIVGGGLNNATRDAWSRVPGVEVVGFVADLREEYRRACLSVVPIWEGGGTKIKLLESLSFQRTCVVARPSFRGYAGVVTEGETVAVADSYAQFSDRVSELLSNVDRRHAMEARGKLVVDEHFTRETLNQLIRESVASVKQFDHRRAKQVAVR